MALIYILVEELPTPKLVDQTGNQIRELCPVLLDEFFSSFGYTKENPSPYGLIFRFFILYSIHSIFIITMRQIEANMNQAIGSLLNGGSTNWAGSNTVVLKSENNGNISVHCMVTTLQH